ncbi:DUF6544 family protein [Muriicola soli]|uniref:Uncharacterized protein n=1 Tax=Muriicola soli TaxID=2507538 RepID=A0A411E7Z5_9FLAO|nr:DUF6544 family protein [Muriicola soli]QBA63634.1 hypothetical protein EQY75_03165 [Muriicola soli]
MKLLLTILLLVHGLIHLLGFLKAFELGQYPMLNAHIGRAQGIFWLLGCLFILSTAVAFYFNQKLWPWLGLIALIISQILISLHWSDTKYGAWFNLILVCIVVPGIGEYVFDKRVSAEVKSLNDSKKIHFMNEEDTINPKFLPPIVSQWLKNSGGIHSDTISRVHLLQKGRLRTKPDGKWMPFEAEQWFSIPEPAFLWKTRVQMFGPFFLTGRDKLITGKGSMEISLLSLIPVVNARDEKGIDEASMTRFLAEISWFPSAITQPYISWEALGPYAAEATFTYEGQSTSGVFTFNEQAEPISFEAMRYMKTGENAKREKWKIRNLSFTSFQGIRIPIKSEVVWELEEGEYHWLTLEISEINYD